MPFGFLKCNFCFPFLHAADSSRMSFVSCLLSFILHSLTVRDKISNTASYAPHHLLSCLFHFFCHKVFSIASLMFWLSYCFSLLLVAITVQYCFSNAYTLRAETETALSFVIYTKGLLVTLILWLISFLNCHSSQVVTNLLLVMHYALCIMHYTSWQSFVTKNVHNVKSWNVYPAKWDHFSRHTFEKFHFDNLRLGSKECVQVYEWNGALTCREILLQEADTVLTQSQAPSLYKPRH